MIYVFGPGNSPLVPAPDTPGYRTAPLLGAAVGPSCPYGLDRRMVLGIPLLVFAPILQGLTGSPSGRQLRSAVGIPLGAICAGDDLILTRAERGGDHHRAWRPAPTFTRLRAERPQEPAGE